MSTLPKLSYLLRNVCLAAIAHEIGRSRSFVWRLREGQPLRDMSVLPHLAAALNLPGTYLEQVVAAEFIAAGRPVREAA